MVSVASLCVAEWADDLYVTGAKVYGTACVSSVEDGAIWLGSGEVGDDESA